MTGEAARELPKPGEVLLGKYRVVRSLGEGGVGAVFEAEHTRLGQRVAIKMLLPQMQRSPEAVARFEREARATARLKGRHVARVYDVEQLGEGSPAIVMELLDGHDLGRELKARGALPVAEAVDLVLEACAAVAEAHRVGIVHRDLKPSNLFLSRENGGVTLKVVDFGISKSLLGDDNDMTVTETTLGTPAYMSPEQVRSAKHVDGRTDLWSLGVILFRALTGKLPFSGGSATGVAVAIVNDPPLNPRTFRPDLPDGLVAVLERALAKRPEDRFTTADELARALAPFASPDGAKSLSQLSSFASLPPPAPAPPVEPTAPTSVAALEDATAQGQSLGVGRAPRRALTAAVGVIALVALAAAALLLRPGRPDPAAPLGNAPLAAASLSTAESAAPAAPPPSSAPAEAPPASASANAGPSPSSSASKQPRPPPTKAKAKGPEANPLHLLP